MIKSTNLGFGLLVMAFVCVLVAQALLAAGSSKSSVQANAASLNRNQLLGYWPLPAIVLIFTVLKGSPTAQALALTFVVVGNQVWTYWVSRHTPMPKLYRLGVGLSSLLAVCAVGTHLYISINHYASAA